MFIKMLNFIFIKHFLSIIDLRGHLSFHLNDRQHIFLNVHISFYLNDHLNVHISFHTIVQIIIFIHMILYIHL